MSGTPIAFPNGPGTVATRAYIGDYDGTLWRLDLHDSNPDNWTSQIAWDQYAPGAPHPYPGSNPLVTPPTPTCGGAACAALAGQPIEVPPVLSSDSFGNPVVVFATGEQDGYSVHDTSLVNYLVSFTDLPNGVTGGFTAVHGVNQGVTEEFDLGERVTGPIAIFDNDMFFATFIPDPSICPTAGGSARICGLSTISSRRRRTGRSVRERAWRRETRLQGSTRRTQGELPIRATWISVAGPSCSVSGSIASPRVSPRRLQTRTSGFREASTARKPCRPATSSSLQRQEGRPALEASAAMRSRRAAHRRTPSTSTCRRRNRRSASTPGRPSPSKTTHG